MVATKSRPDAPLRRSPRWQHTTSSHEETWTGPAWADCTDAQVAAVRTLERDGWKTLPPVGPIVEPYHGGMVLHRLIPDAGNYNDEDAYNLDTEGFDARKVKVSCPGCGAEFAALCSKATAVLESGWRWVGCDHREPYAKFRTEHRCGQVFTFTTYTPQ